MYGISFNRPKPYCPRYPERKSNVIPKDQEKFTVILEENGRDYIFPETLVNEFDMRRNAIYFQPNTKSHHTLP